MKHIITLVLLFFFMTSYGQSVKSTVASSPPMGWNSYDCFGAAVHEDEIRENAAYVAKHLKSSGWNYVVVDFCWFYPTPPGSRVSPPQQTRKPDGSYSPLLAMDSYGRLLPVVSKFPSARNDQGFKPLGDYIHSLGLKFGIHVMRGIPRQAVYAKTPVLGAKGIDASMIADTTSTCSWLNAMYGLDMDKPGAQQYLNSLLKLYASWGVDFIKVDDISRPYHAKEIVGYHKAIQASGRPMVLSISPGATPLSKADHVIKYANQWRLADDFWDSWRFLVPMFGLANAWAPYGGPGHWPNLDMLPIGKLSKRGPVGPERYSRFTRAEERTMMTLWCISRSPLILGGNLPENRPEDLAVETNSEVLGVDQHGLHPRQLFRKDNEVVWVSRTADGKGWNVAFFNLSGQPQKVDLSFSLLGITHEVSLRDLWEKKDLGKFKDSWGPVLQPHDAALIRLKEL